MFLVLPHGVVFRSGTDLIALLILLLLFFLLGRPAQKWSKALSFQMGSDSFGTNVLQVNTRRLMELDFHFDVKLSRWRPWRHFTHKSAATRWEKTKSLLRAYAAANASSWFIVQSYFWYSGKGVCRGGFFGNGRGFVLEELSRGNCPHRIANLLLWLQAPLMLGWVILTHAGCCCFSARRWWRQVKWYRGR